MHARHRSAHADTPLGGEDPAIFAPTFDPLVAVLVQGCKIFPQLTILGVHGTMVVSLRESKGQGADRGCVELVLVGLSRKKLVSRRAGR